METLNQLTVFYDGQCLVCFKEIKHYKKLDKNKRLKTIDISATDFKASDFGLDEKEVHINMHSITEDGTVFVGVDTFREIWKRVSPYSKVAGVFDLKALRPVFNLGYKFFAYQIRPRLPKRDCDNGSCRIMV